MIPLFDTHMHLNYFPETHGDVVARAIESGVEEMITISTALDQAPLLQSYVDLYPSLYYSTGQHPHDVKDLGIPLDQLTQTLIALKNHPKMIAYGETGLDYHYDLSPRNDQITSFKAHIEAALHHNLPIVVHTREAEADTMAVLSEYKGSKLKGVIHCFSGTKELAEFSIHEMDFLISFSGILTFLKAFEIQEVASTIPLRSIMIETDSPYLAPVPYRGKGNEPMYLPHVFDKLCSLRPGEDRDYIAQVLRSNVNRLFGV